jgi:hypothetical protein
MPTREQLSEAGRAAFERFPEQMDLREMVRHYTLGPHT